MYFLKTGILFLFNIFLTLVLTLSLVVVFRELLLSKQNKKKKVFLHVKFIFLLNQLQTKFWKDDFHSRKEKSCKFSNQS